jgi:hypothetical protein
MKNDQVMPFDVTDSNNSEYYTDSVVYVVPMMRISHRQRLETNQWPVPTRIGKIIAHLTDNDRDVLLESMRRGLLELQSVITMNNSLEQDSVPVKIQDFLRAGLLRNTLP